MNRKELMDMLNSLKKLYGEGKPDEALEMIDGLLAEATLGLGKKEVQIAS